METLIATSQSNVQCLLEIGTYDRRHGVSLSQESSTRAHMPTEDEQREHHGRCGAPRKIYTQKHGNNYKEVIVWSTLLTQLKHT
mmetsp:Transcript_59513/g.158312  ORF Transcript_59513/g.158312 Transcript_59513/m.158312 type:complete len:84 (+) Transcript_59513:1755-2006(+)